jgi:hypothetical protein
MKNVIKLFSVLFLVSGAVVLNSCKEDPAKDPNNPANWDNPNSEFYRPKVTGVTLTETDTLFIEKGETATLVARIVPENAFINDITWESSEESIAAVDNSGKVTTKKEGVTKITARTKENNFTASRVVVVVPKMQDNFSVEAIVGRVNAQGQISQVPTPLTMSKPTTLPTSVGQDGYHFVVAAKNTSGQIIPKGTTYKAKMISNGVSLTTEEGFDVITGTTSKDYAADEFFVLVESPAVPLTFFGEQELCGEILQVGKTAYPTKITKCVKFTINDAPAPPSTPKSSTEVKKGKASNLQIPIFGGAYSVVK